MEDAVIFTWQGKHIIIGGQIVEESLVVEQGIVSVPVRTSKGHTCLYRASCDAWDADIHLLLRDPSIFIRFSLLYMKFEEPLWLTPKLKMLDCFPHFMKLEHILCHPDQKVLFKLVEVETCTRDDANVIELIKERVRTTGPVIGCMSLRADYMDGGVYHASGKRVPPSYFENHENTPKKVDDPMAPTPRRLQDPKEEEEKKDIPIQRKDKTINAHAVAIVGYGNKDGIRCFIVQDSLGRNQFWR